MEPCDRPAMVHRSIPLFFFFLAIANEVVGKGFAEFEPSPTSTANVNKPRRPSVRRVNEKYLIANGGAVVGWLTIFVGACDRLARIGPGTTRRYASMRNEGRRKLACKRCLTPNGNEWGYRSPVRSVLDARHLMVPGQRQIFLLEHIGMCPPT